MGILQPIGPSRIPKDYRPNYIPKDYILVDKKFKINQNDIHERWCIEVGKPVCYPCVDGNVGGKSGWCGASVDGESLYNSKTRL